MAAAEGCGVAGAIGSSSFFSVNNRKVLAINIGTPRMCRSDVNFGFEW